jgi:hypothetical protein
VDYKHKHTRREQKIFSSNQNTEENREKWKHLQRIDENLIPKQAITFKVRIYQKRLGKKEEERGSEWKL